MSTAGGEPGPEREGERAVLLRAEQLSKWFGAAGDRHLVLDSLSFTVTRGEVVGVVGPSGAGKTTLLRCLVGLEAPGSGRVIFDGEVVDGCPSGVAMVFQDYSRSLFPWMTVNANVAFPLENSLRGAGSRADRRAAKDRVAWAIDAVGLTDAAHRRPWQLSGGMQQRVSIARALASQPGLLVMDEPFASVDALTRASLEDLVLSLQRELGITVLLVTHDIDEAVYLSDRVLVLSRGPARLRSSVDVPLGRVRDQVTTKADPQFTELRGELFDLLVHRAQAPQPGPAGEAVAARDSGLGERIR